MGIGRCFCERKRKEKKKMGVKEMRVGGKRVVIEEMEEVCESGTGRVLTGSWVWESAVILSEWMTAQRELDMRGKTVLELGAGAGIPGLMAAMLGATRVVLTDIQPLIPALFRNVEANGLGNVVEVRNLLWGTRPQDFACEYFDLVLMSDLFFDTDQMGALAQTLKTVCGENTKVWAVTEVRPRTVECLNVLADKGFGVLDFPCPEASFAVFCLVPLKNQSVQPPPTF